MPPWTTLRTLEEASRNFENDKLVNSEKWLNQLIRPGSSLGGARPKATVVDTKGQLWIAKFPSKNDDYDTGAWEKIVHDLASMCQLNVPESFIYTDKGWILSPLFDVNPVPYGDELSLNVNEDDNRISMELILNVAPYFGISREKAEKYTSDMLGVVRDNWEKLANKYGISRGQTEDMRPAFSFCENRQ